MRRWSLKKLYQADLPSFHIFLEVSKILRHLTDYPETATVLLVAPTGTAAFNIGVRTIHSAFNLRATGFPKKYVP